MRPRINRHSQLNVAQVAAGSNSYPKELYTVQHLPKIYYYKRVEAIKKTIGVAVRKCIDITLLLNGSPFCRVNSDGSYDYIYNPEKDNITSPSLKQLFKEKGIAIN